MNKKNIRIYHAYQGSDEKIFRETMLKQLLCISKYIYNFYINKNYNDDYFCNKNLDFITSTAFDSYPDVKIFLKNNFTIISEFENRSIKGIFFKNNGNLHGLIFIPQISTINRDSSILNRDIYTFTISELNRIKEKKNLYFLNDFEKFPIDLYCGSLINCIAFHLNITIKEFLILLYENSLNEYIKYFNICKDRKITAHNLFQKENRTHTEICSFYYYWVFRILGDVLPHKDNGYSFHDVGTQLVFLPAMILKLNTKYLMNVKINKIIASDNVKPEPQILRWIKKYTSSSKNIKFNFNRLNLLKLDMKYPKSDITIVIDVLEHLPDDDAALKAVFKLWERTKEILIIHFPIETEETKWHDHNILFDANKIRKWGNIFKDGKYLSDCYKDGKYNLLTDLGFLILKKQNHS